MSFDRLRPRLTSKTTTLALLAALLCAGAAWMIDAGSALAPEPADLFDPLAGGAGATAEAIVTRTEPRSTVVLWPGTWTSGGGPRVFVGAPCSTYGPLPLGVRPTKRIEARGSQHRCVKYDPTKPPPADAVRPLPPMPVGTGTGTKEASDAITTTVTEVVTVILWPADWAFADLDQGPAPFPGQPCSDFEMLAGETTYKHIQTRSQTGDVGGPYRCVRIKDPIVYPAPPATPTPTNSPTPTHSPAP